MNLKRKQKGYTELSCTSDNNFPQLQMIRFFSFKMTNTHSWQSVTILNLSKSVVNLYIFVQSNLYVNIRSAYTPLMGIFKGGTSCLRLEYLIRLFKFEHFKTLCMVTEEKQGIKH